MDFSTAFLQALHSDPVFTKTSSMTDYLPGNICTKADVPECLPKLTACRQLKVSYPYQYEMDQLDSLCLIHTRSGSASLTYSDRAYHMTSGSMALILCTERHRVEIRQSPWEYDVFFLTSNPLSCLYELMVQKEGNLHVFSPGSALPAMLEKLLRLSQYEEPLTFSASRLILDILLEGIMEKEVLTQNLQTIPAYLRDIRLSFEQRYQSSYSLDQLSLQHKISKYRICRDFTKYYNVSPMQYLNEKRIEAARELLRYSDSPVHEIGYLVGIENTNHFIRLFRQQTGVTPSEYRKHPPV